MASKQLRSLRKLTFEDLSRFEETLKPPFRRALNAGTCGPPARSQAQTRLHRSLGRGRKQGSGRCLTKRAGRLVVPLFADGQPLGLLVIWQVNAEQLHPAVSRLS